MTKTIKILSITTLGLVLSGCTSATPASAPIPNSPSFNQGKQDGCTTATGDYTKNSESFRVNADYQNGWFYGRKHCNPAQ